MRGWRAADLAADRSWHVAWEPTELAAFDSWLDAVDQHVLAAEPNRIGELIATAPTVLLDRAQATRQELISGRGLTLLSGLANDRRPSDRAVAFLAFSALMGSLRSQNGSGHLLGHVTDVGADATDPTTRIYQTNQRQTFHTDSTDAVGLFCLRGAKAGGASMVVNVEAVYERIQASSPELAQRLFEPVATDRRGEQPDGELPWFEIPVLSRTGDRITGLYQRQYIDSATRFADAPRLDADHIQALDLFDEVMNDPDMHLRMDFAPGDIQHVHNHSLLHDRTGFVDYDDVAKRRYLMRVWLSLPGDRELPESFKQRYGSITVGDRGGIVLADTKPTISFAP